MYFQSKARNEGDTGIREQPGAEEEKRAENEGQKKQGEGMEGWKEVSGAGALGARSGVSETPASDTQLNDKGFYFVLDRGSVVKRGALDGCSCNRGTGPRNQLHFVRWLAGRNRHQSQWACGCQAGTGKSPAEAAGMGRTERMRGEPNKRLWKQTAGIR